MLVSMLILAAAFTTPETCRLNAPPAQGYASGASWYIDSTPIVVAKRKYEKYGLPRVLTPSDISPFVLYKGAKVFIERADKKRDVIYVLVGVSYPGEKVDGYDCDYQPYQRAK